MSLLKKLMLFFFIISNLFLSNLSYSSNYFDKGLKNISSEIEFQIISGYDFDEFNEYLAELESLYRLDNDSFIDRLKIFTTKYNNCDFLIFELNRIFLGEITLFINVNYMSFANSFEAFHGRSGNNNFMYELFITHYLKKYIEILTQKIRDAIISINFSDITSSVIIDPENNKDSLSSFISLDHSKSLMNVRDQSIQSQSTSTLAFEFQDLEFKNLNDLEKSSDLTRKNLNSNEDQSLRDHFIPDDCYDYRLYEKTHRCLFENCKKSFDTKDGLKVHEKIHFGEKKFICHYPGCTSRFLRKQDFKVHYRTHTKERPYKCIMCDRTFTRSTHKKDHEKAAHNLHKN